MFRGGPNRPVLRIVVPDVSVVTRASSVPTGMPRRKTLYEVVPAAAAGCWA
jgi:hypothetical protein